MKEQVFVQESEGFRGVLFMPEFCVSGGVAVGKCKVVLAGAVPLTWELAVDSPAFLPPPHNFSEL